jgi:putative ABC transport system permease protein
VWLLGWRDLQWRRRRFLIAVVATALVFAMTLLMTGITASIHAENHHIVRRFDADAWVVASGTSGPFTASTLIPVTDATRVAAAPGVRRADPIIVFRSTVGTRKLKDVNVLGVRFGGVGSPKVGAGRLPRRAGEVLADTALGLRPGAHVAVTGHDLRVVGTAGGVTFYFGTPTIVMSVEDAQRIIFGGQPLATAVVTRGVPAPAPSGLRAVSNDTAISDLERPMKNSDQTLALIDGLLWLVAAGIIGSIIYLSALERARDFAVLKATGASTPALLTGLTFQAVLLALGSAVVAVLLALVLAPIFPFTVAIPGSAFAELVVVAVVVGLVASLAGLRRAVGADPALAFGAA